MVWIWSEPREISNFDAVYCGCDPRPHTKGLVEFSEKRIEDCTRALFETSNVANRFRGLHAPPTSTLITVDSLWKDIVMQFVPENRIQFIPAQIMARGEICDDFSVMIPFDRVVGIDKQNSEIRRMVVNEHGTHIFSIKKLVLLPGCLGNLHLARDKQMDSMLLVSDDLRNSLAATGQESPFYTVEEYNERFTWL